MNSTSSDSSDRARVQHAERSQVEWRPMALDQLLPAEHRARTVWRYVDSLDLSALYSKIQAVEGKPGRDAVDPKILMALWMFATIEAISSARQVARLCERDLAYMWICGNVGVNHHLLSDFRTAHGEFLDQLLTDTIATLLHQGLITLDVVAQDGMRVRANAGKSSFRRKKTLKTYREEVRRQVQKLREEAENESETSSSDTRRKAARMRAATEREQRVEKALKDLEDLRKQKEKRKKGDGDKARCSTTDAEARNMKMGDGGFRPAYNVQFASTAASQMILSVDVVNSGSDRGQMAPMHKNGSERYAQVPRKYLVDGGFVTTNDITEVEQRGSQVLAPIRDEDKIRERGNDPYARARDDTDETYAFRQRMATEEAKELYKQRPSIAELPNAECRNRGLTQFRVRGQKKVRTVALWYAITINFMRMLNLGCKFEANRTNTT